MRSRHYGIRFWKLAFSSLFFFMGFFMIIPELPDYLSAMGGERYKGFIVGLFAVSAGLSRPFSGKLTDVIGRKPVMLFGAFITVALGCIYPFVGTVAGFLFLRFIHGFSAGFNPTGTVSYVADIIPPERRGEAMGILGLMNNVGLSLGPAIGSAVASAFGVNVLFAASAIVGVIATLLILGIKETLPNPKPITAQAFLVKRSEVFEKRVLLPGLVMLLTVFAFGAVLTLIPDMAKSLGMKNKGLFFTVLTASSIAVRILTGRLSDRFGRIPVLMGGTLLLVAATLLIAISNTVFVFLIAALVFGLATGTNSPTLFAWAIDRSDRNHIGRGMATLFIALEAGVVLGSFVPMEVYNNNMDHMGRAFLLCSAVAISSFVIMALSYRKSRAAKVS